MTEKAVRDVWVAWRHNGQRLEFFGGFETEAKAMENLPLLHKQDFFVSKVLLVGWAFDQETGRVFSNDDPKQGSGFA